MASRMSFFLRYWLPPLAVMGGIFTLSSGPLPPAPISFNWSDKIAHLGAYALLGGLLWRAFRNSGPPWTTWCVGAAILGSLLFGASDEIHQFFVPERCADVTDWLADALGTVAAVGICRWSTAGNERDNPAD